ncbi:DNA cytosine methyltransferase [Eubacteriales bacterium OttesenSCG-928-G02]|nr:DNA cytosine methyltransferase [Eubacteriales bacterium OttesenSCG-928-G02]
MPNKTTPFTFIDLFAGAGGLSEGFLSTGFKPIAHVEMNTDACLTLQTRACYYYLLKTDKIDIYSQYLSGEIDRNKLYSLIPRSELDAVINQTMSKESMPDLFAKIDRLMDMQNINSVDIIVGGPPCQAYSLVGRAVKSDGMQDDPRNFLYQLYCRVLKKYQPQMFVFENVPGLLTANGGRYFANMKKEFRRFGYEIHYKTLNAFDFGVLQNRLRVILIGWKKDTNYKYPEFDKNTNSHIVNDIFSDLPVIQAGETNNTYQTDAISNYLSETGIRKSGDILTWNVARPHIERDRQIYRLVIEAWNKNRIRLKYSDLPKELRTHKNTTAFLDRFKVVAADIAACHTVMAHISKDGHYFIHPDINQARSITVREAARLQSFPDNYFFESSRTAAFTQIGNAVPPLMAKGIARGILNELERGENNVINK